MTKNSPPKARQVRALRDCFVDNTLYKRGATFVTKQADIKGLFETMDAAKEREFDAQREQEIAMTLKRPPGTTAAAKQRITGVEEVVPDNPLNEV